jgi:hypothetical protein
MYKNEELKDEIKKLSKGTTIKIALKNRQKLEELRDPKIPKHRKESMDELIGKLLKKCDKVRK